MLQATRLAEHTKAVAAASSLKRTMELARAAAASAEDTKRIAESECEEELAPVVDAMAIATAATAAARTPAEVEYAEPMAGIAAVMGERVARAREAKMSYVAAAAAEARPGSTSNNLLSTSLASRNNVYNLTAQAVPDGIISSECDGPAGEAERAVTVWAKQSTRSHRDGGSGFLNFL